MCFTCLYTYIYCLYMTILFASFVYLHYSYKQSCNCVLPAAISCGPAPDAPANGQRSGSGTTFRSTVTYTCNTGYTPQGDNGHTCMANGEWSGRTPTCNRKLLTVLLLLLYRWASKVHQGNDSAVCRRLEVLLWLQRKLYLYPPCSCQLWSSPRCSCKWSTKCLWYNLWIHSDLQLLPRVHPGRTQQTSLHAPKTLEWQCTYLQS